MKNARIVKINKHGETYFIVQQRVWFFFWSGVGSEYYTFQFKTIREAERQAMVVETWYSKTTKTIIK